MKYVMFIYYKPVIEKILNEKRQKFWRQQDFSEDIMLDCNNLLGNIKLIQTCAITAASATVFLYMLRPCFGNTLIFEVWLISDAMGFTAAILLLEYYTFCLTVPVMFGYDSFYLAFCADVVVQVRLLKCKLKQLTMVKISDSKDELDKCIKHHQLLQG